MLFLSAGNRFSHFPMAFRGAISGRQWIHELRIIKMFGTRALLRDLPLETIFHGDSRTHAKGHTRARFHVQVRAHGFAGVNASSNN